MEGESCVCFGLLRKSRKRAFYSPENCLKAGMEKNWLRNRWLPG
jgi:hypothetical protein